MRRWRRSTAGVSAAAAASTVREECPRYLTSVAILPRNLNAFKPTARESSPLGRSGSPRTSAISMATASYWSSKPQGRCCACLSKSAAGSDSMAVQASRISDRVGFLAAAASPEATGAPELPENMTAARSLSAEAASSAGASSRTCPCSGPGSPTGATPSTSDCSMLLAVSGRMRTREGQGKRRPETRQTSHTFLAGSGRARRARLSMVIRRSFEAFSAAACGRLDRCAFRRRRSSLPPLATRREGGTSHFFGAKPAPKVGMG